MWVRIWETGSIHLKLDCKVVAVEPQPDCADFLRWKFCDKFVLIQKGMSDHDGEEEMNISESHTISSFANDWVDAVSKSGRFQGSSWEKKMRIEMSTLDKVIKQFGEPVFIKIDVEGYEPTVIRGLSKSVRFISFEYTVPEQVNKVEECLNHLSAIDSHYKFNYSTGETFEFSLPEWVPAEEMRKVIASTQFMSFSNGDVYAKK